ncbi:hypothetical protein Tco_1012485 [Tanacetum coccineum]
MIPNPNNDQEEILEPLSKMTARNKSQYIADVKVEFDKFAAKEGESLESVYERLTTLVNIIDRNNVRPILVSINTKFLNCLQPEWIKYVTMVRYNQTGDIVSFDVLYDSLVQFEPHVLASKAKKATATKILIISLYCSFNGFSHHNIMNAGRQNRNQAFNAGTGKNDETNQIKPRVRDAKYFREKMLLAMKDEAGSNLNDEENDFMLDNSDREKTMEELTTAVMSMARIQPANGKAEAVPSYDRKAVSEVTASSKVHEQVSHVKYKTIIQTSDDDQIDSNIIFDDPYVDNNGGTSEHDSNAHDEYHEIQILAYNVQREDENQK